MSVRIETIPPQRIAFVRHTGPYCDAGSAWTTLMAWAGPRGLLGPQAVTFGLAYDDPDVTPPEKIRYDACINVAANTQAEGDVGVRDFPGGEYAVAVHTGPFERLKETYAMLYNEWLPASGRSPGEMPALERYLNDPRTTPPDQLRTEVCIPIV